MAQERQIPEGMRRLVVYPNDGYAQDGLRVTVDELVENLRKLYDSVTYIPAVEPGFSEIFVKGELKNIFNSHDKEQIV